MYGQAIQDSCSLILCTLLNQALLLSHEYPILLIMEPN